MKPGAPRGRIAADGALVTVSPFVTRLVSDRQMRFFVTAPSPCPYLPGQFERKVFAHLPFIDGAVTNDELAQIGFRRSQTIAYRPACDGCDACVATRLPVDRYAFSRGERRVLERNADLTRDVAAAEATPEQFDLLRRYLDGRHPGGGMSEMTWADYVPMVEDTAARTRMVEYRLPSVDGPGPGDLVAAALVDRMNDGFSMVYLFFDPRHARRSLGRMVILDHVREARRVGLDYVYLGYWVSGSPKMDYKADYRPLELLRGDRWVAHGS